MPWCCATISRRGWGRGSEVPEIMFRNRDHLPILFVERVGRPRACFAAGPGEGRAGADRPAARNAARQGFAPPQGRAARFRSFGPPAMPADATGPAGGPATAPARKGGTG